MKHIYLLLMLCISITANAKNYNLDIYTSYTANGYVLFANNMENFSIEINFDFKLSNLKIEDVYSGPIIIPPNTKSYKLIKLVPVKKLKSFSFEYTYSEIKSESYLPDSSIVSTSEKAHHKYSDKNTETDDSKKESNTVEITEEKEEDSKVRKVEQKENHLLREAERVLKKEHGLIAKAQKEAQENEEKRLLEVARLAKLEEVKRLAEVAKTSKMEEERILQSLIEEAKKEEVKRLALIEKNAKVEIEKRLAEIEKNAKVEIDNRIAEIERNAEIEKEKRLLAIENQARIENKLRINEISKNAQLQIDNRLSKVEKQTILKEISGSTVGTRVPAFEVTKKYEAAFKYHIPFKKGQSFKISEGYLSSGAHEGIFALDFSVPEGTLITAARDGIVFYVMDNYSEGCDHKDCDSSDNILIIKHPDGTYAKYGHLKQNGVSVVKGDSVTIGQPIAVSGSTGRTKLPVLHFEVIVQKSEIEQRTIKTNFKRGDGSDYGLLLNEVNYTKGYE